MSETTCKRCGAKIKFLKTEAGKWLPVDPTPRLFWSNPDGKEKVMLQSGEVISCDLTGDAHHAAGEAYIPHFATCKSNSTDSGAEPPNNKEDTKMNEATMLEKLKARFEAEAATIKRPGIENLMNYVCKSDFYTAPASTKYHLSCKGGLLIHSLNVLDALRDIMPLNENGNRVYRVAGRVVAEVPDESVTIMALFHDLCKTYFYTTEMRNKKVNGRWKEVPFLTVDDRMPLGHGDKSVMLIKEYIKLTSPEMYAIWFHMGFSDTQDNRTLSNAVKKFPVIWAMHTADTMAAFCMEDTTGNKDGFTPALPTEATNEEPPAPEEAPPPVEDDGGFEEALPCE